MVKAKIEDPQASSKGLRHGFAVHCIISDIPITLLQKWMGHADISTTSIYLEFGAKEERVLAQKMC